MSWESRDHHRNQQTSRCDCRCRLQPLPQREPECQGLRCCQDDAWAYRQPRDGRATRKESCRRSRAEGDGDFRSKIQIEDWKSKDLSSNQITKRTMYDVISDTVKLPPKTIAFIVLLIFSISIELGIFTLAPHTNKIDNMVVGDEETISNTKKKRKVFKKEEEVIPIEPIIEQPIKQEIKPIVKPEFIQEVQKILPMKIEHRAEEILQSLDEDKPAVSSKVKRMIVQM